MLSAEIMFRNKGGTAEIIRPLVMKISFFYDLSRFDEDKSMEGQTQKLRSFYDLTQFA